MPARDHLRRRQLSRRASPTPWRAAAAGPVMFGIKGWADAAVIERYAHHWIAIGQAGRFFRLARAENCREVLFIGSAAAAADFAVAPRLADDPIAAASRAVYRGGDDKLLSGVARHCRERAACASSASRKWPPKSSFPKARLAAISHPSATRPISRARSRVIAALGPFDVGQAAVVANNNVLAVEAAEGTDNMLARIAELRRLGRVTAPLGTGVLVKAPKPGQDRRFDLPSIGPRTIENMARAGLAGVAVTAGSTMIAEADRGDRRRRPRRDISGRGARGHGAMTPPCRKSAAAVDLHHRRGGIRRRAGRGFGARARGARRAAR